jgi:hypothetical protein
MGHECRLNTVWLWVGLLAASAAASCSHDDKAEARRRVLQTEDRARERLARIDAHRVLSPEGELLPSETKVAGVVLPRGFELKFAEKHAWSYDGNFQQSKVEAYFAKRITRTQTTNKPLGEVEYLGVREKSNPNMEAVLVRLSPGPQGRDSTRIYIAEPVPADPSQLLLDDEALRKLMAERRRNAR